MGPHAAGLLLTKLDKEFHKRFQQELPSRKTCAYTFMQGDKALRKESEQAPFKGDERKEIEMKKIISIVIILVLAAAVAIPAFASSEENAQILWVNCANGKRLNLRTEPVNGKVIVRLDNGTRVEVLEHEGAGWALVTTGRYTGYVQTEFLQNSKPGKYEITERADSFKSVTPYLVVAKALNGKSDRSVGLRVKPNKTAKAIRRLEAGDELQVIAIAKTWSKVVDLETGKTGYVANDYIERI